MKASLGRRQKGAAAIEFALVFVMFFAVFYGLLGFSLPLLMVQSFNQASSEAVRRCVALDPSSGTYAADVQATAKAVLEQQLSWMSGPLKFQVAADANINLTAANLLTVTINYDKAKLTAVIPVLNLPLIGEVPRIPAKLGAQASLQL
ncbi:pilus assembly protein TadE [Pseudomonas sp. SDI]|uniref:TadE/TadG family type IV pilus assembly protein n=1 Tax=Pseudomonas sp. SDI TaxID=2170734 RepID=UPI000DE6D71C|nr:TadE/TadG family type IV pilus assembly protein [Pseudomonas sp. SDI]PWB29772.1 pilus assembly protein TadE [Pseudomonas sp. SDI]